MLYTKQGIFGLFFGYFLLDTAIIDMVKMYEKTLESLLDFLLKFLFWHTVFLAIFALKRQKSQKIQKSKNQKKNPSQAASGSFFIFLRLPHRWKAPLLCRHYTLQQGVSRTIVSRLQEKCLQVQI